VRLFIDTLKSDRVTDPVERAKCLDIIDREMVRLDVLVGKLIALSKLEAGRQPFEQTTVSVAQLVDDALGSFEVMRVGAAVDLAVEVQPGLEVTGDRATLVQVLSNLLGNAWKYSPPDSRKLALRAHGDRRHVYLDVTDNGPGVPEVEKRRIFDEFERGRAATQSRAGGFGLGLAIVRAIVRAHAGKIDLHDNPGGGALFRVTLPRRLTLGNASAVLAPVRARSEEPTR